MQDSWNTIKRPNLWIMGTEEEEAQTKGIENIFNKVIVGKIPKSWEKGDF
jgi:hypothetical protein